MVCLLSISSFVIIISIFSGTLAADCVLEIDKLQTDHPLLIQNPISSTVGPILVYPLPGSRSVILKPNAKIDLACTGSNIKAGAQTWGPLETATCSTGTKVIIKGKTVDVKDLACTKKLASSAIQTNNNCPNGKIVNIGYAVNNNLFVVFFTVCFNSAAKIPVYSRQEIKGNPEKTSGSNVCGRSDSWTQGSFYLPEKLDTLYTKKEEQKNINAQLGLTATDTTFIDTKSADKFLAKGHLAACADFIYSAGRTATFHYVNAAPQWQKMNRLSWFNLEKFLRNYAVTKKIVLTVYTGVYRQLALPNNKGVAVGLFLSPSKSIPVPEIFWKLVYHPQTNAGVAIIGYNNIYSNNITPIQFCKDVSGSLTWFTFAHSNPLNEGYIYACEVNAAFRNLNIIPTAIPELSSINKLLT